MTVPSFALTNSPAPERLFAGDTMPRVAREVVVAQNQIIVRGSVLGRITANAQWVVSASAAADGSQVPRAIAAAAVTTGAGQTRELPVFVTGEFAEAALTLGAGHTLASIREGLADLNIYLRTPVAE